MTEQDFRETIKFGNPDEIKIYPCGSVEEQMDKALEVTFQRNLRIMGLLWLSMRLIEEDDIEACRKKCLELNEMTEEELINLAEPYFKND